MKKLFLLLAAIVTIALGASAQTRTYHGTVLSSADDEPLLGATVMPIGGGQGTSTDIDGKFTLSVPASVKEARVSFVGMTPKVVALSENMKVFLDPSSQMLDQVVVTGYGSGKKLGSVVGAVTVVGEKAFEDTPSANFVDALQGQVSGLNIFSNSGEPSSTPAAVRIRGINTLGGNTPLYICDGAPTTANIWSTLNPSDIENVTVLKDAASTAIYGSRAANGVIVITTKKGKYGEQAKVTVRANVGWSDMAADRIDLMDSKQYLRFRELIGKPITDQTVLDLVNVYGVNTNWKDYLIKDHALTYSLETRIQGGTERTRYYISLSHYDQDGLIEYSGLRRQNLRLSLDSKVKDWLTVGASANVAFERYESNNAASSTSNNGGVYTNNPFMMMYNLLPYDSPYYYSFDSDNNIVYGERARYYKYSGSVDPNYYNSKAYVGKRTNVTAMVNLYEQITPIKGLTLRAQQNVNAFDYRSSSARPPYEDEVTPMGDKIIFSNMGSSSSEAFQRWYQFTYTNTAEYKFSILDKNEFSFLVGQESIITRNSNFAVTSTGQPNAIQNLLTQGTSPINPSDLTHSKYESIMNSYFLTGSYSFDNRYFLDFSVRRDGSSKFAPDHRWGTFYSVGGMWNMKSEKFLQDVTWLSDLKVRANYGTSGSISNIGNYDYMGVVGSGSTYNGNSSFAITGMENPYLSWETVKALGVGVSFGFLDERIRGSIDFYRKNTVDMLMDVPMSFTTGWDESTQNCGKMRNTGVDVELGFDIFKNKDWFVGMNVNFNYNKNVITELFNGLESFTIPGTGRTMRVGKNPFAINSVRYAGVDPRDGQQMWYTKDGNLTKKYDESDEVDLGKTFFAPWNGGFALNASWKGLSLSANFNWSADKYIFNATNWYINDPIVSASRNTNGTTNLLNVWTKPGDVTDVPNLTDLYGRPQEIQPDSRWVENASFMRLKNLTVAYSLPKTLVNKIHLSDLSVHFTGRNLLTITPFHGVDPEYEGNVVQMMYPNTRQYEFGIEVSF